MKTIALIGGMSWESTVVYYQLLNRMARALGRPAFGTCADVVVRLC